MKSLTFWVVLTLAGVIEGTGVNSLNGSVTITYVDFSVPGPVLPVELVRIYNSITAVNENGGWSGAFGWGWTSLSESILSVTGEQKVLLRDGLSGNTLSFVREKEDSKVSERFLTEVKKAFFQQKLRRPPTQDELQLKVLPPKMQSRLQTDPQYRADIAVKYGLKSEIPRGEVLVSSEYGYQTITFRNNVWVRVFGGISQHYNKAGLLVRQIDKNGFGLNFSYVAEGSQLAKIESEDKSISIRFVWKRDRIVEVVDSRARRATYSYDTSGNLTRVTDSAQQVYAYFYENRKYPHLITQIEYVNEGSDKKKVFKEIRYDDRGLVTYVKEKNGTETQYTYGKNSTDPENNFWTKWIRIDVSGQKDEQFDEYTIKTMPNGVRYLYRQETRRSGNTKVVLFTPCCGKPAQIIEEGKVTQFTYYADGLLKERSGPDGNVEIEYDPRFKKISRISQEGVISTFRYDPVGNLILASNSLKRSVTLTYDKYGRIVEMKAPAGAQISFSYGNFAKPVLISEKLLGSIRITYDESGRILRTETAPARIAGKIPTERRAQEIVRGVTRGFRELLDIIRPAGI